LGPVDIESLERSVVAAVAPAEAVEIGGWLVPLDPGPIGRSKSAVPLTHDPDVAAMDEIVEAYRSRGLEPRFRLAEVAGLDAARAAAVRHGLTGFQPTVMKLADAAQVAAVSDAPARLLDRPDEAWTAVFMGEGFDPADAVPRVANLSRAPGALFGAAGAEGTTAAVGVATLAQGLGGVHGMRTAPAHRGQGYAAAILAAFGRALMARGVSRIVLQVEEPNPARRIYRRAGFEQAWIYRYWR
jgi:GNAT superfamily N-acetyltransferase